MVHLERDVECYGCYRKFNVYPAMIIHLESGTCSSEIDILDLNESAALCYQWKEYLDEDYREDLLSRVDIEDEYEDTVYPFKCPKCDVDFTKLSDLFQHVYSKACDQGLHEGKIGKLIIWLKNRHYLSGSESD